MIVFLLSSIVKALMLLYFPMQLAHPDCGLFVSQPTGQASHYLFVLLSMEKCGLHINGSVTLHCLGPCLWQGGGTLLCITPPSVSFTSCSHCCRNQVPAGCNQLATGVNCQPLPSPHLLQVVSLMLRCEPPVGTVALSHHPEMRRLNAP